MNTKEQFTTVTPFSKYLALILFIVVPFCGFWLGVEYGKKNSEFQDFYEPFNNSDTVVDSNLLNDLNGDIPNQMHVACDVAQGSRNIFFNTSLHIVSSAISPDKKYEFRVVSDTEGGCQVGPSGELCAYGVIDLATKKVIACSTLVGWREWTKFGNIFGWWDDQSIIVREIFGDAGLSYDILNKFNYNNNISEPFFDNKDGELIITQYANFDDLDIILSEKELVISHWGEFVRTVRLLDIPAQSTATTKGGDSLDTPVDDYTFVPINDSDVVLYDKERGRVYFNMVSYLHSIIEGRVMLFVYDLKTETISLIIQPYEFMRILPNAVSPDFKYLTFSFYGLVTYDLLSGQEIDILRTTRQSEFPRGPSVYLEFIGWEEGSTQYRYEQKTADVDGGNQLVEFSKIRTVAK